MKVKFFKSYGIFIHAIFLFSLTSGCGNKKSSSNVQGFSNPAIPCNPAFGNNCGFHNQNGNFNSNLYTNPTDLDSSQKIFEAMPFPGDSIKPTDFINYYRPRHGGVSFNGRVIFGPKTREIIKYEFIRFQSNDAVMNKYYPLMWRPNRVRDTIYRNKEDILSDLFDKGLGTRIEAFKVCLQTVEKGSLQAILIRKMNFQGQITFQSVGLIQGPIAINPVYEEEFNPYSGVGSFKIMTNGRINGQAITMRLDQSNYQAQSLPIVGCQY